MNQPLAEVWRETLAQPAPEPEAEPVEMTFDGLPCKIRPATLEFYIRSGRMPDYLTRIALADDPAQTVAAEFARLDGESYLKSRDFQRTLICDRLVEPRVVDVPLGQEPEGAFSYMELAERRPKFVDSILSWFLMGCPVPAKGGEGEGMDAEALANFPKKPGRRKRAGTGSRRKGERKASVGTDAADTQPDAQV